jgi:ribosomal protein L40E
VADTSNISKRGKRTNAATVTSPAADAASENRTMSDNTIAPAPDTSGVDITPAARLQASIAALTTEVVHIGLSIAELDASASVYVKDALNAALEVASGNLALMQAEFESISAQALEVDAAHQAAQLLPVAYRSDALASMLAAIERKYAIAPPAATEDAPVDATVASGARKQVSPRTAAINAQAAGDSAVSDRGVAALAAWDKSPDAADCLARRDSGTRFPSFVPLASNGEGVASYADLQLVTAAVRNHMRFTLGINGSGNGTAVPEWLARRERFSPAGNKSGEYAAKSFASGATIALYPDGKFRLARRNAANVRHLDTDAAAYAAFVGKSAGSSPAAAPVASAPLNAAPAAPDALKRVHIPQAPNVMANASGGITTMAFCQHCSRRNPIGATACVECGDADWQSRD